MARRLLINADDFGLTAGVNRAVLELHQAHVLRSATLMATGDAFEEAAAIARQNSNLGVGCHVVLTDGTPVLPPSCIPSLLGKDRRSFRPSLLSFLSAVLLGRVHADEVALEAEAQIRHLQSAGVRVTHVDTHKHTHILPPIARALTLAMERTGVRAIRNPFEPLWSVQAGPGSRLRRLQVLLAGRLRRHFEQLPAIREGRVLTTNGTLGVSATGHLDRALLHQLLDVMPEGTWELVCHPGYNDAALDRVVTRLRQTRDVERLALLEELGAAGSASGRREGGKAPIELIHYGEL